VGRKKKDKAGKLPKVPTAGDLAKAIKDDGWYYVKTRGDHHQYKHPKKPGKVTIPKNPGDELSDDVCQSILKQAGLEHLWNEREGR
jgi:predicted RNA binding protein YcfA (HicA-like mRNA interferase family)